MRRTSADEFYALTTIPFSLNGQQRADSCSERMTAARGQKNTTFAKNTEQSQVNSCFKLKFIQQQHFEGPLRLTRNCDEMTGDTSWAPTGSG